LHIEAIDLSLRLLTKNCERLQILTGLPLVVIQGVFKQIIRRFCWHFIIQIHHP